MEQVYVLQGLGLVSHIKVIEVSSTQDFTKSSEDYFVIRPASIEQITLAGGDKILVKIQNETDLKLVSAKYTPGTAKMSVILPYNNNGCFYPPQVVPSTGKLYPKTYFLLL